MSDRSGVTQLLFGTGIGIVALLAIVGALAIGFLVWSGRTGVRRVEVSEMGRSFGQSATDALCLSRAPQESDPALQLSMLPREASWLEGCLLAASRTDEFCSDVPHPKDPKAESWIETKCEQGVFSDESCYLVYSTIQEHCAGWLTDS